MKKKLEYYSAEWCGPCKMFKPTIEGLINEGYNIDVIDVDENPSMSQEKRISAIPTLIFTEKGKKDKRFHGTMHPSQIRSELEDGGKSQVIDVE